MPPIKVFVSVGRISTAPQEDFVSGIESYMLDHGLLPQALGRNYWSSSQPLRAIDELMNQSAGVAIIGFERLRIVEAIDRRGSGSEQTLNDFALPTVWNQVEAAMAYARGLPLLVVIEDTLRCEGLLEASYDWYVKRVTLDAPVTSDREFRGIFNDWRSRVAAYHAARKPEAAGTADRDTGASPTLEARDDATQFADRRQLRTILETRFSDADLRVLCYDLKVNYENVVGETKAARVIAIMSEFERKNRTEEFLRYVKELRPDVTW